MANSGIKRSLANFGEPATPYFRRGCSQAWGQGDNFLSCSEAFSKFFGDDFNADLSLRKLTENLPPRIHHIFHSPKLKVPSPRIRLSRNTVGRAIGKTDGPSFGAIFLKNQSGEPTVLRDSPKELLGTLSPNIQLTSTSRTSPEFRRRSPNIHQSSGEGPPHSPEFRWRCLLFMRVAFRMCPIKWGEIDQGCRNGRFGKRCFVPCRKQAVLTKIGESSDRAFYP